MEGGRLKGFEQRVQRLEHQSYYELLGATPEEIRAYATQILAAVSKLLGHKVRTLAEIRDVCLEMWEGDQELREAITREECDGMAGAIFEVAIRRVFNRPRPAR